MNDRAYALLVHKGTYVGYARTDYAARIVTIRDGIVSGGTYKITYSPETIERGLDRLLADLKEGE